MYLPRLDSKTRSRSLQIKQAMSIPSAFQQSEGWTVDVVPLPLLFGDLLLGAEPVLFFLGGFTIMALIQLIGPFSYYVLCSESVWHHRDLGIWAFGADDTRW